MPGYYPGEYVRARGYRQAMIMSCEWPQDNTHPVNGKYYKDEGGIYIGRALDNSDVMLVLNVNERQIAGKLVCSIEQACEYLSDLRNTFIYNSKYRFKDWQFPTREELSKIFVHAGKFAGVDCDNEQAQRWCLIRNQDGSLAKADLYSEAVEPLKGCDEWLCVFAIRRIKF